MARAVGWFNTSAEPDDEPMPVPVLRCPTCGAECDTKAQERGWCKHCRGRQVTAPGEWWDYGNCKVADEAPVEELAAMQALFFRDTGKSTKEAMAICHGASAFVAQHLGLGEQEIPPCPVINQCRDYAVRENIQHGVWGGTTERERRALRRELWPNRRRQIQQEPPPEEYPAAAAGAS